MGRRTRTFEFALEVLFERKDDPREQENDVPCLFSCSVTTDLRDLD